MVYLISTFEPLRIPFIPQFVEHYLLLGVDRFLLSVQIEPEQGSSLVEHATQQAAQALKPYGIELAATLRQPFNSLNLRTHHDKLQSDNCAAGDWTIWADLDEYQVYPGDFGSLLDFAGSLNLDYFHGYLVDRVSADGRLRPFDPAKPLWTQYPRRFTPPGSDPVEKVWKVTCARPHVPVSRGNHFPLGPTTFKYYADPVEIHHFKWDDTVVERLSRRLMPDFREACDWWTESRDLLAYIEKHGRVASAE
jgi:hypothetical protein